MEMHEMIIQVAEFFYQKRIKDEEMTEEELTAWEILRDELEQS